ncbi:MAG: hypothetical protein KME64_34825 [Scytonematopsis contorta HA4267-MV1]|jgi:hypothetical protein|nr:hypothetical protein [Scytonematopsis contorta HA4267-MV1]
MVERPIKKSERQPQPSAENDSQSSDSPPPVESTRKVLKLDDVAPRERKGKKSSSRDDSKQPQQINPALVRGPKPPKPQPKVEAEPEPESEPESESTPEE